MHSALYKSSISFSYFNVEVTVESHQVTRLENVSGMDSALYSSQYVSLWQGQAAAVLRGEATVLSNTHQDAAVHSSDPDANPKYPNHNTQYPDPNPKYPDPPHSHPGLETGLP
eukprot:TRINITY_DN26922_c0_g1_i1.p1 TRINITY_DN26922_c0_g1~~TRINITY_DN26922_c0_g1_i1.p1  ORF type:complete len:113 (+),score=14.63 TRINITY_DN26922_c0_g1_i1:594-932(+)